MIIDFVHPQVTMKYIEARKTKHPILQKTVTTFNGENQEKLLLTNSSYYDICNINCLLTLTYIHIRSVIE